MTKLFTVSPIDYTNTEAEIVSSYREIAEQITDASGVHLAVEALIVGVYARLVTDEGESGFKFSFDLETHGESAYLKLFLLARCNRQYAVASLWVCAADLLELYSSYFIARVLVHKLYEQIADRRANLPAQNVDEADIVEVDITYEDMWGENGPQL